MNNHDKMQIYALGDFRILRGGGLVDGLRSRKAQALLVYLAMTTKAHAREALADLLWSESSAQQALSNLRDAIHALRKHLEPFISVTRHSVSLNPEAEIWLDAAELDYALDALRKEGDDTTIGSAEAVESALELYQDDLLRGFYIRGAQGFEEWATVERERIRHATIDGLLTLVSFYEKEKNYRKGIYFTRRTLEFDPLMETAHQHLIRMLAFSGRTSEALLQYDVCRQVLNKELGIEPSEDTQEFYRILSMGDMLPGAPKRPPMHNLPTPSTSFIGREEELGWITAELLSSTCRLLTLKGVGGIGKTRLGIQVASAIVDSFPQGVWLAELASLTEEEYLPEQITNVFGVSAQQARKGREATDVLAEYLMDKRLLLVLDNCEHVIGECAKFIEHLLSKCPHVKFLVTSREELGVPGERVFEVPPLMLPPEGSLLIDPEKYPAVNLFVDRAAVNRPRFTFTLENSGILAEICRQLDGIPLAIELAAARIKVLSLEQISERLQNRFRLLTGGPRTALPRHQTLLATMDWSYSLLSSQERALLKRLSVFTGGWDLKSAEEITGFGEIQKQDVLDLLDQLEEKSLIRVTDWGSVARYGMLETVRQYGVSKLIEEGEAQKTRKLHAEFFAQLATQQDEGLRDYRQLECLQVLDTEHENLRAALSRSIDSSWTDTALQLVAALGWYWFMRGYWKDSWQWLNLALNLETEVNPVLRARAICWAGGLQLIRGNLIGTMELLDEALEISRENEQEEDTAWCLNLLGQGWTWRPDEINKAIPLLNESVEIFKQLDDGWGTAWSLRYRGQVFDISGDFKKGLKYQEQGLKGFEAVGDDWNAAHSRYLIGNSAFRHGHLDIARKAYQDCLDKCDAIEDKVMKAHGLRGMAQMAAFGDEFTHAEDLFQEALEALRKIGDESCMAILKRDFAGVIHRKGDFKRARLLLEESLNTYKSLGVKDGMTGTINQFASLAAAMGNLERAARLLGASDTHFSGRTILTLMHKEETSQLTELVRGKLGDQNFEQIFSEGMSMNLEEAVAYAMI